MGLRQRLLVCLKLITNSINGKATTPKLYFMPKTFLLFSFLISGYFSLAQNIILSGRINNSGTDTLLLAISPNLFSVQQAQYKSLVNAQGRFSLQLPVKQPTLANIAYANNIAPVFLEPNTQLQVHVKPGHFRKTLKFKGQGARENNFLTAYQLKFAASEPYRVPDQKSVSEEIFLAFLNKRKKDQLQFLGRSAARNTLSEAFKNYMLSEIEYSWANACLQLAHPDYRNTKQSTTPLAPINADFLNQLELNNPDNMTSPAYASFLKNYFNLLVAAAGHRPADPDYYLAIYNLVKEKMTGEPRNLMLASTVHDALKKRFNRYTGQMLADFESQKTGQNLTDFLAVTYDVKTSFVPGSPAPDFKLVSTEGKEVALADFSGKMICLNFWKSTGNIYQPALPGTSGSYLNDKNIVFININLDGDESTWRQAVQHKKLTGPQLFAADPDALLREYKLAALPAYYLLDTDGTFISTKARYPELNPTDNKIVQALIK